MALEQALARLERALEDLAGSRDQLAEELEQAIAASLRCVAQLDQFLCAEAPDRELRKV